MRRYDALVIGAGPAGATAALLLARAGWSVAIAERSRFPRSKVCGEFITPAAFSLLHDLCIADVASEAGPEVRRVALWTDRVAAIADMPRAGGMHGAYGRAVSRDTLDARLLQHAVAAGAELWQPFRARKLCGEAGAFECEIEQSGMRHRLAARCVIAAHGSWEVGELPTQRRPERSRPDDLLGFKTYMRGAALAHDLLPLMFFPGGYAGLVHEYDGRVNLSCCVRRDALAVVRTRYPGTPAGEALLLHLQAENVHGRHALADAHSLCPWLACGPLRPGVRRAPVQGMFLVGNAAGETHPLVGEGVTMALQSAALLCDALLAAPAGAWAQAASAYERKWDAQFAARVRVSAAYAGLSARPHVLSAAVHLLARAPGLLTLGACWSGKSRAFAVDAATGCR